MFGTTVALAHHKDKFSFTLLYDLTTRFENVLYVLLHSFFVFYVARNANELCLVDFSKSVQRGDQSPEISLSPERR